MSNALEGVYETLSAVLGCRWSAESVEHELDHGELNHGFAVFDEFLVVFAESPIVAEPSERAFHHPASGEQLKTNLIAQLADDFQHPATPAIQPTDQLPSITTIGPDQRYRRQPHRGFEELR